MNTPLDNAITDAAAKEAVVQTDQTNLQTIQAAIAASSNGLAPAQSQLASDIEDFNTALDTLSQAALAAKLPMPVAGS